MPLDPQLGPVIVDAAWLATHLDEVVVADVRWYLDGRSGQAAYDHGHVPGAIFVDVDRALADPPGPEHGRHPLPSEARFAAELGALGIPDGVRVVAYDDAGGAVAGRLVWLLRRIGQAAALLDGGLAAWTEPLEEAHVVRLGVVRAVQPWPADLIVDADEAAAAPVLLDARAPQRYRGEVEPIDPRAGHIPGARNLPVAATLDGAGHFRDPAELRQQFAEVGVRPGAPAPAVYCGSGVNACQVLLAMEIAGLAPGRLYAGSWSQWSSDSSRPAATSAASPTRDR